jgi:hypothetical protein
MREGEVILGPFAEREGSFSALAEPKMPRPRAQTILPPLRPIAVKREWRPLLDIAREFERFLPSAPDLLTLLWREDPGGGLAAIFKALKPLKAPDLPATSRRAIGRKLLRTPLHLRNTSGMNEGNGRNPDIFFWVEIWVLPSGREWKVRTGIERRLSLAIEALGPLLVLNHFTQ